jgi:hypothetical protein
LTAPADARWPLSGSSMRPLGHGWTAHVRPDLLRRGDLVCYLGPSGRPTVHRVHAVAADALVVRGDTARPEPQVPTSAIIGRVVALERFGLVFPLPAAGRVGALMRAIGIAWSQTAPWLQALRAELRRKSRKV